MAKYHKRYLLKNSFIKLLFNMFDERENSIFMEHSFYISDYYNYLY